MMKEIEEMSSDDDDAAGASGDDDSDDAARRGSSRNKRVAKADLRGKSGGKKLSGRAGAMSTFASADDFGSAVDEWHAQLVQVCRRSHVIPRRLCRNFSLCFYPSPSSICSFFKRSTPPCCSTAHALPRPIERLRLHLRCSRASRSAGKKSVAESNRSSSNVVINCKFLTPARLAVRVVWGGSRHFRPLPPSKRLLSSGQARVIIRKGGALYFLRISRISIAASNRT